MPVHTVMPADRAPARKAILRGAWLGILTYVIPPDLAGQATAGIAEAAAGLPREKRPRQRMLTPRVTLYFVLGLCLFSGTAYAGVFLQVTAGLGVLAPATAALSAARARLGSEPVKALFERLCTALTWNAEEWSHVCGLLLVAWDGTTLALADTEANAAVFGRPGAGGKKAGQQKGPPPAPAARVVLLIACGTRAALGAAAGPFRGKETGERELARDLLPCLRKGMLHLADKGFYSYALWQETAGTGADLLWRAKDSMHLPVIRELPDGSFLAHVNDPRAVKARGHKNKKRRYRRSPLPPDTSPVAGITVRVIQFTLTITDDDGTTRTAPYRLITTLLDHRACPAHELAAAYARRWVSETIWREIKTCLRGTRRALRGKTPDLACQEIWALLAVYQAIRTLITLAAARDGINPARISFTTALEAIRRTTSADRGDRQLAAALAAAETEILAVLITERPHRTCPRAVKRAPYNPWPIKKPSRKPVSQHATRTATITPPGQTIHNSPDQRQQPPTSNTTPP